MIQTVRLSHIIAVAGDPKLSGEGEEKGDVA
jgi:hypothetical protein